MKTTRLTPTSLSRHYKLFGKTIETPFLEYFYNIGLDLIMSEQNNDELFIHVIVEEIIEKFGHEGVETLNMRIKQVTDFHNETIRLYEEMLLINPDSDQKTAREFEKTIGKMLSFQTYEENIEILSDIVNEAIDAMAVEYEFIDMLEAHIDGEKIQAHLRNQVEGGDLLVNTFSMLLMHEQMLNQEHIDQEELFSLAMLLFLNLATLNHIRQIRYEIEEEQSFLPSEKVYRNDPCPCGSGKKYKMCCLGKRADFKDSTPGKVYQLRIDLMDTKPPIWRRILIESSATLYDLHCAIQGAMGWSNGHLHGFEKDHRYFGPKEDEDDFGFMETLDETQYHIDELLCFEKEYLYYEYDFGDGWRHRVRLEKVLEPTAGEQLPRCIKGKLACPPEDIGGVWGYYEMLEALQDTSHPEHTNFIEWIGKDFDPTYFDIEEANKVMREGCGFL